MFTVVTGFFDIKRENWDHYNRTDSNYFIDFRNLLSLDVNMVIFIEKKNEEFIKECRQSSTKKTTIVIKELEELCTYKYLDRIIKIQEDPSYAENHANPIAPEICKPLYNVVTCSKMSLVKEALNYSNSHYFIWLDAGYTHSTMDLSTLKWNPTNIFARYDKFSFISLQSLEIANDDPKEFFLQYTDVIIGGFFGGYRHMINKVVPLYYELFEEMLDINLKDDDQFYNTILAKRHPELFNVIPSSWYGAMYFT
jgi:protein YibB